MHEAYTDLVIPMLAQHLGVKSRELALSHDLYEHWGFTPLSLVVVLVDLERVLALELPTHELGDVHTVGALLAKFRGWMRAAQPDPTWRSRARARRSRHAQRERRIRRELHFLRWIEQNEQASALRRANSRQAFARQAQ